MSPQDYEKTQNLSTGMLHLYLCEQQEEGYDHFDV